MNTKEQKREGIKKVKKTTLNLDADLHKRLRIFALEEETSMTDVVEKAVEIYMNQKSKRGGR